VNLSQLGRVELAPSSGLKISFTENSINGLLESGSAQVSTLAGVSVNFTTKDGVVSVDGSQPTSFTVNIAKGITSLTTHAGVAQLRVDGAVKQIAAGETATAGIPNPQDTPGEDDDDLTAGETFALVALGAGAIAAIIYAAMHGNDVEFGGTPIVISPAR
jgi:ferric-dicitrate binding protein FerR (iron transport regulator)